MTAMRLISSERPWTSSIANPIMISALLGHCGSPPAFPDCSLTSTYRRKKGMAVMTMTMASGKRKNA